MVADKAKKRILSGLASIGLVSSRQTSSSAPGAPAQRPESTTYRVRGIPLATDERTLVLLLEAVLGIDTPTSGLVIGSLADAPNSPYKLATISFSICVPPRLAIKKRAQWSCSLNKTQLSVIYNTSSNGVDAISAAELVFDCHFLGITPLTSFAADQDYDIDCIALSGLGGHAFGSFKQRGESYMWLRDTLPRDLPNARIMMFGYDSELVNSESFQNVSMLASMLRNSIAAVRSDTIKALQKPIIFIAHSLGGVLVKQALIQMANGSDSDQINIKAIYGMLFFGVPSQGMNIESLVAMVGDQPNRYLLESLGKESDLLQQQKLQFPRAFPFQDSKIICFYETMKSPTAHYNGKKWTMTGKPSVWVDSSSATYSRPWETGPEYNYAINKTHSEMVNSLPMTNTMTQYGIIFKDLMLARARLLEHALEVIVQMTDKLHLAVRNGASKQVQTLINHGANVNAVDDDKFTPLHRAAEWCDAPMITLLLESSADVAAREKLQWTPLHVAARYNSSTAVNLLIAAGAEFNARTEDKCTPLHLAARYNQISTTVKALLDAGCDINGREINEWTPLLLAARYQAATAPVKVLVDAGADMSLCCDEGYGPLHLAAGRNSPQVLKILLDAEAFSSQSKEPNTDENIENANLIEAVDADGWTALHWAVRFGREDNIRLLKKYGANAAAKDILGRTPAETTFVDHIDESVRERISGILKAWNDQ